MSMSIDTVSNFHFQTRSIIPAQWDGLFERFPLICLTILYETALLLSRLREKDGE